MSQIRKEKPAIISDEDEEVMPIIDEKSEEMKTSDKAVKGNNKKMLNEKSRT